MAKKSAKKQKKEENENLFFPTFDQSFLAQHTAQITVDPEVAIIELVANAWDAWPNAKTRSSPFFWGNVAALVAGYSCQRATVDVRRRVSAECTRR